MQLTQVNEIKALKCDFSASRRYFNRAHASANKFPPTKITIPERNT